MKRILILGYGNPDRGDDGAAWVTLANIASHFGHVLDNEQLETGFITLTNSLQPWLNLQLIPELAEDLAGFEQAIFVDAHTEEIQEDVRVLPVQPEYQNSPFTHHLTPSSCLALSKNLYGGCPQSILVSIRGYEFGFSHQLSLRTSKNASKAEQLVLDWLEKD